MWKGYEGTLTWFVSEHGEFWRRWTPYTSQLIKVINCEVRSCHLEVPQFAWQKHFPEE